MTAIDPTLALQAAQRPLPPAAQPPRGLRAGSLCIAGGGGALGSAVVEHALARGGYAGVEVLTVEPLLAAPRGLRALQVPGRGAAGWTDLRTAATTAVLVFDAARARESAFYMPEVDSLPQLAASLRAAGVRCLAVVLPHAPALLPAALRDGLWTLDEVGLAQSGFERLLFVRPAAQGAGTGGAGAPGRTAPVWRRAGQRLADWMLGNLRWMVAASHQPVRAAQVASVVFETLRLWDDHEAEAPTTAAPGVATPTRVLPAEVVWAAAQPGAMREVLQRWWGAPDPG